MGTNGMGTTSFLALLFLFVLPSWSVGQTQDSGATKTSAQTKTSARTTTKTNPARQGNAPPQRAPDGDVYKPPASVQPTPKNHPPETNTGRPPAQARGNETGWAIGGAAAAGGTIALGEWLHAHNKPAAKLSRDGPKIPDQFNMSDFSVGGFCQRNWPVVVDYVLNPGVVMLVSVETQGVPAMNYSIQITGSRRLAIFRLPAYFPQKPTPGMYTIRALTTGAGATAPAYARLFGLGAGERAVGSVAIDQLRFGPNAINPKEKQEADYAFHAHTDFDRVRAEFMRAVLAQGQLISKLEDHDDLNGVQRETTPTRKWNGKKATPGDHLLQVRAWESALNMSNWVIAWSADQVLVQE